MARLKGSDLRQLDTAELERKLATLAEETPLAGDQQIAKDHHARDRDANWALH